MTTYPTIEALEAAAREALKIARDDEAAWRPTRAAILNVFNAYPMRAFPAQQIGAIASAVEGMTFPPERIQAELTKLVRGKTLRTQTLQGKRRYEVAL